MERTLVVGDVHGCIDELDALLGKVDFDARGDRLVLVGDLVAKGPDSRGVVRRLRELKARAVKGNHDEKVLSWWRASKRERREIELKPEHQQVVDTLGEADWKYLAAMPAYWRVGDGAIVVHGGLVPGVELEAQREEDLISMRSVDAHGEPSRKIEGKGLVPWASVWRGPELAVFGHDAVRGLQRYPHALGLDTGCVYGRELTGVILPERVLVSVKAKRQYAEMK